MTNDQMREIARRVLAGGTDTWAWRVALEAIRDAVEPTWPLDRKDLHPGDDRPACASCGAKPLEEVTRTITRLLSAMDDKRIAVLATLYGAIPAMLCAPCFMAALGVINKQVAQPAFAQPVGE